MPDPIPVVVIDRAWAWRPFTLEKEVQDLRHAQRVEYYCRLQQERGFIFEPYSPPKSLEWLERQMQPADGVSRFHGTDAI